jgi:hypothetical protein
MSPTSGVSPAEAWRACAPLLAGTARVRLGRRTATGRVDYRSRDERALTGVLPLAPAAVRVYGADGCCATLCLDLDASRGGVAAVDRDAAALTHWLDELGVRWLADISPNGGRHVYVPAAPRIAYDEARDIVEALAGRYPTLDASPHRSLRTGCIRPPGASHATGGHQQLTVPLSAAYDALRRPNGPEAIARLQEATAAAAGAWRAVTDDQAPSPGAASLRGLSARVCAIATHGLWDTARYASPSEARQAVITGAVRAGWTLADVAARLHDGRWPGLASLYARYGRSRHGALARDWTAASRFLTTNDDLDHPGRESVRRSHTSRSRSQGGALGVGDEHGFIRTWRTALRTFEQQRFPGRAGYGRRFVLRALGEAAHKTGSRQVAFGVRSLAVAVGLEYSTVAAILRDLAGGSDPWIALVADAQGEQADVYELRIPDDVAGAAERMTWDRGRAHGLRPAFRELGHVAALVFEAVENGRARTITDLVPATGLSRSAVHEAVDTLAAWSLVERRDRELHARSDLLIRTAEQLGVVETVSRQIERYRKDRRGWRAWLARHEPDRDGPDGSDCGRQWWWPPDDDVGWTLTGTLNAA